MGAAAANPRSSSFRTEPAVLDVVYVLGVVALFMVVAIVGKAVEKL